MEKDVTEVYLFPPNVAAPGGVTPLHLAASMQDSEDIVDALTNDPQENDVLIYTWMGHVLEDKVAMVFKLHNQDLVHNERILQNLTGGKEEKDGHVELNLRLYLEKASGTCTCQVPNKRCQLLVLNGLRVPPSSMD
ncbi:hypothetical protein OPV22_012982 [Ensete ventricosum]|uniref:Uncharacterized protein n=1 Tax=Ensete ventricosum TaxID=4639 RepID=A0AAV8R3W0_ENSVE|nr:hypothetical protein OPV22_012982 [Ensete ventricosum]